jgi:hypothetical protein
MSIKQNGGIFGRNPTFNDVTIEGQLTFDGDIDVSSDLKVDGDVDVTGRFSVGATHSFLGVYAEKDNGSGYVAGFRASNTSPYLTIQTTGSRTQLQGINSGFTDVAPIGLQPSGGDINVGAGNFVMTSGYGIDFSATSDGSGTSTSELFDDYEEGTWTPTIGGVSVGSGNYTKVGALIFIECLITANSLSTTTINGLPYDLVSAQGYGGVSFGRLYNASVLDANGVPCRVRLSGGNINFRNNAVNATDSNFTITTPASGTVRLGINGVARVS